MPLPAAGSLSPQPFERAQSRPETTLFASHFPASASRAQPWRSRLGWVALGVMLCILGGVLTFEYGGVNFSPSTVSSAQNPYGLNLSASRVDDNLMVKWDRQSPAIKAGLHGVLTITEGSDSKDVQLDGPQLLNGTVLYRHIAPEVKFKLQVLIKDHSGVLEEFTWRNSSGS
jgi:hypothetical protein